VNAAYSALAPDSLTTLAHFTISVAWYLASSSGVERTASSPNVFIRSATSGNLKTRSTSAFNLSMTGLGVLAGANMANQVMASKPGNVSATVGTSGAAAERLKTLGLEAVLSSSDELAKYQAAEIVKWAKVVKDSGAKAE